MIRRRQLLLGGLALPVLAACSSDDTPIASIPEGDGFHGTVLPEGWDVPDVELTDHNGEPFNLRTGWDTKAIALFFGYLNCPDVCPGIMADMATARRRLPEDLADDITPIVITTDPARDTPEALKDYLARVDDKFIGLTGDLGDIMEIGAALNVHIEQGKQLPSGGYEVDHSTQIMGIGEDRKVQVIWTTLGLEISHLREDYSRLVS
ncbi:MAG: SCO family protein [Propionibacterium sp.]|nr:SCO family protein [Propionibacterium sp.]